MNYSDEELLEYLDSQMSVAAARRLRDAAETDTLLSERIDVMEASRLPYSAAYREMPVPQVPETLKREVSDWSRVARSAPQGMRAQLRSRLAGVAGVALSIGAVIGYVLAPSLPQFASNEAPNSLAEPTSIVAAEDDRWVVRVADYQSLYVAETVGHTEGGRARAEELLSDLQERSILQTAIPDLGEFGYTFARAQQLGFEGEALVQLVYTRAGRKPLALCYMAVSSDEKGVPRLARREALGTASWRQNGQRFVIVADESASTLSSMVEVAGGNWL